MRIALIAALVALVSANTARAAVVWSASFESYNEGDNLIVNDTTGALDTLSSLVGGDAGLPSATVETPGIGVELSTGLAARLFRAGPTGDPGAVRIQRNSLPAFLDNQVQIYTFDLHQTEFTSNQLWRLFGSGPASEVAASSFGSTTGGRLTFVANRTDSAIDLPIDTTADASNPDNVDADTMGGFLHRLNGTKAHHSSLSMDRPLNAGGGDVFTLFQFDDNGFVSTAERDHWFDNFIISDDFNDAFLNDAGEWRNVRDLTVGTRPTSTYLRSGTTPVFSGSVVNSVDFTPSIASSGTVIAGESILDIAVSDAGWVEVDVPYLKSGDDLVLLLDLTSSHEGAGGLAAIDYVVNEIGADAALRGYLVTTSGGLLDVPAYSDFDVLLTISGLDEGVYNYSFRLGGDGSVSLAQIAAVGSVPEPSTFLLVALGALAAGRRCRSRRRS